MDRWISGHEDDLDLGHAGVRDDIATRSDALHDAKNGIAKRRRTATRALFEMFDCVRALEREHFDCFPEIEAWLKTECGITADDIKVYLSFEDNLGPHRDLLEKHGTDLETIRSLMLADGRVRDEALELLKAGHAINPATIKAMSRSQRLDRMSPLQKRSREQKLFFRRVVHKQGKKLLDGLQSEASELYSILEAHWSSHVPFEEHQDTEGLAEQFKLTMEVIAERAGSLLERLDQLDINPDVELENWFKVGLTDPAKQNMAEARRALEILRSAPYNSFVDDLYETEDYGWSIRDGLFHLTGLPLSKSTAKVRRTAREPLVSLELCAGIGGEAIGLMAAGFSAAVLIDEDKKAVETLAANWSDWNPKLHDVLSEEGRKEILSHRDEIDLLAGGLPCQPFSQGGKHRGEFDKRQLFTAAADYVRELRPRAFAFENVTGFANRMHTDFRRRLISDFSGLGYDVHVVKMDARDYGLAQGRKRVVLVGLRHGYARRFRPPILQHPIRRSFGDTIVDLVFPHRSKGDERTRSREQIAYDKFADKWIGLYGHEVAPTLVGTTQEYEGRTEAWKKRGFNPMIRSDAMKVEDVGSHELPWLTPGILQRLQGIPDEWRILSGGDPQDAALPIANAFPPPLARAIGLRIREALTGEAVDLDRELAEPIIDLTLIGERRNEFNLSAAMARAAKPLSRSEKAERWRKHFVSERELAETCE